MTTERTVLIRGTNQTTLFTLRRAKSLRGFIRINGRTVSGISRQPYSWEPQDKRVFVPYFGGKNAHLAAPTL